MSQIANLAPTGSSSSGDVVGPASSTDNAIARFDGTTGKLLQNSGVLIDDSDNVTGVTSLTIDGATGNVLIVDTDTFVVDATNDRVGVGQATPTAAFHLKAGTAAAGTGPLKFTAGTNLTAPEEGVVEFDGTNLFYTDSTPTRQTLAVLEGGSSNNVGSAGSSTDNAIARWDGATGQVIQDSGVLIDDSDNVTGVTSLTIDGATGNVLIVDTDTFVVDATNDRVGVGQATPTAAFHLKAGTAAAGTGPLKFTSGTNLTAPEEGVVEFDGTNLFYTDSTPTRQTLAVLEGGASNNVGSAGSSTDNAIARWDGATGQVIQDSGWIIEDSPAGYTGSELIQVKDVVQTTDATPTDLVQITLDEDEMLVMETYLNGFQSDFTDSISACVKCKFFRQSGGDVTAGTNPEIWISESDANTDVTIVADTGNQEATIQVTGVAAQTWNWVSYTRYFKTLTNS